jgi:uncharacterized protein
MMPSLKSPILLFSYFLYSPILLFSYFLYSPILLFLAFLLFPSTLTKSQDMKAPREFDMPWKDTTITMKKYVMCIYLAGPHRGQTEEEATKLQEAHLAHQDAMHEKGVLAIAGPFDGGGEKRGILIFDLGSVEEARPYVDEDPMVKAGRLTYELLEWWTMKGAKLP